jgi:large subunit ribosomal protein L5
MVRVVMSHLKAFYQQDVVTKLMERFAYKNMMQVPKLSKIVLNMGLGEAIQNIKILDSAVEELRYAYRLYGDAAREPHV